MIANTGLNTVPTSTARSGSKSAPVGTASEPLVNPAEPQTQRPAPSQAIIAQLAYEIWVSEGQEPGSDQKHWFEAEKQLQLA